MSPYHPSNTRKDGVEIGSDEHYADLKGRAEKRMEKIDALPPKIRALVHEYGWDAVKALMDLGAKSPGQIEHIILACRGADKARKVNDV